MIVSKVIIEEVSDKQALDLDPFDPQKSLHFLQPPYLTLLCCNVEHLFYTTYNQAKDQRKSPFASKMFPLKLANLTKIISKTLRFVGLRPPWLRFRKRKTMIDEGNKVAKLSKLLK